MAWLESPVNYVWHAYNSLPSLAAPATAFVLKMDINNFYKVICLLIMFLGSLFGLVNTCRTIARAYTRIVATVSTESASFLAKIVAITEIVALLIIFYPVIFFLMKLTAHLLVITTFYVCGNPELAVTYVDAIAGGNQPAIAHRR
jgi:hypothetical protein